MKRKKTRPADRADVVARAAWRYVHVACDSAPPAARVVQLMASLRCKNPHGYGRPLVTDSTSLNPGIRMVARDAKARV